jgi:hypothetical protein
MYEAGTSDRSVWSVPLWCTVDTAAVGPEGGAVLALVDLLVERHDVHLHKTHTRRRRAYTQTQGASAIRSHARAFPSMRYGRDQAFETTFFIK